MAANIASVKIEGRQRSPAYVTRVAKVWRQAIDRCKADPQNFVPQSALDGDPGRHVRGDTNYPWRLSP